MRVEQLPPEFRPQGVSEAEISGLLEFGDRQGNLVLIDLSRGARHSLILGGQQILTAPDTMRFGGKLAVSHICSPQFGKDTLGCGLPQHGTARDITWELSHYVLAKDRKEVALRCAVGGGTYPPGLVVGQVFRLEDGVFQLITCHKNTGEAPVPVYFGEHFYFWTGYQGWEKLTINGVKVADEVRRTAGRSGVIALQDSNLIELPGRRIEMRQVGLPNAVLWAGSYPIPDAPAGTLGYESHYVCIEPTEGKPGFFGTSESMIQPEDFRVTQISLKLIKD